MNGIYSNQEIAQSQRPHVATSRTGFAGDQRQNFHFEIVCTTNSNKRLFLVEENQHTTVRILTVAEKLFATNGYERTTLRQVTTLARVNLASVNYHFGDKETLFRELIVRRLKPMNLARLKKLETAQRSAGDNPVVLDLILHIFFEPMFELTRDTNDGGSYFVRIVSRSLVEPLPVLETVLAEEFHPVTARFAQALRRHVPGLAPDDFLWRISFIVGAMHHTLATLHRMTQLTRGVCKNGDCARALDGLIQCSKAILSAPPFAAGFADSIEQSPADCTV